MRDRTRALIVVLTVVALCLWLAGGGDACNNPSEIYANN